MDVLEELLVAQVLGDEAGEALECRVHEGELQVHAVGDDPLAHARGDRAELPGGGAGGELRAPAPAPLQGEGGQQTQHHQHAGGENGGMDAREQL